jgi:hypothetical protein
MSGLDVLRTRVAFRDRSVSDVLDLALRFVVVHGRVYAKVALWTLLPFTLVALAVGFGFGWRMAWLFALPLALIAEIPFTVLASRLVFQDEPSARDVLIASLRDGPRVVFARLLAIVLVMLGAFMFVIPGIWLATIVLFLGEVMLLERASIGQAFGRSQRVASSAMGDVLLGTCLFALLPAAAVLLFDIAGRTLIGELFQFRPPAPVWSVGGGALATLGVIAQAPYLATARFFLYLNIRTRAEGWDIQTRFAVVAAHANEEAGRA